MTFRSRKELKEYRKHRQVVHAKTECIFCDIGVNHEQFIQQTKSFKIIKNIFPYSNWDNQDVTDHLLIVPRKHTDRIGDFSANEAVEYVNIMASYENEGYNIWSRAPHSVIKSVAHQHTHLIKPGRKRFKFVAYVHKPHIRITR